MDEAFVTHSITTTFAGVETATNFGYTFFFYGADHTVPFATIASSDNAYEQLSHLDRPGVFRLNIRVSPQTFRARFGVATSIPAITIIPPWTRSCRIPTTRPSRSSAS
jgi:hypothetical protein